MGAVQPVGTGCGFSGPSLIGWIFAPCGCGGRTEGSTRVPWAPGGGGKTGQNWSMRLRLGPPEVKKVPDIRSIPFGRLQVIHEQREALPLIVLQHGRGWLTAGNVLALTPEGIFRVDARDLTQEWVAGLENIPPDADGSALKLVEHWEGSIEVRSEESLRAWRLDADGGRLEPVLRSPAATWNAS